MQFPFPNVYAVVNKSNGILRGFNRLYRDLLVSVSGGALGAPALAPRPVSAALGAPSTSVGGMTPALMAPGPSVPALVVPALKPALAAPRSALVALPIAQNIPPGYQPTNVPVAAPNFDVKFEPDSPGATPQEQGGGQLVPASLEMPDGTDSDAELASIDLDVESILSQIETETRGTSARQLVKQQTTRTQTITQQKKASPGVPDFNNCTFNGPVVFRFGNN